MNAMKTTGALLGKKTTLLLKAAVLTIGTGAAVTGVIVVNERQAELDDRMRQEAIQSQVEANNALFDAQQARILLDMNDLFTPKVISEANDIDQELQLFNTREEIKVEVVRSVPLVTDVPQLVMKEPAEIKFEQEKEFKEEQEFGISSLFQFSGEDYDYFNKYGLERNIDYAEFEGGKSNLDSYIQSNLVYPEEAYKKGIQGLVEIEFTVEKDGSISNIRTVKGLDPQLDAEAQRLVSSFPKWKPKEVNDEKVRSNIHLPIRFEIQ